VQRTNSFIKISSILFILIAIFHVMIGVYHTFLFTVHGSQSMFSIAYGIPVTAVDMHDRARALGADAIEVYSILLFGAGIVSMWASWLMLRGQRLGFWLNAVAVGIAELAILCGLIIPGQLSGANGYASPMLYVLAVLVGVVGIWKSSVAEQH